MPEDTPIEDEATEELKSSLETAVTWGEAQEKRHDAVLAIIAMVRRRKLAVFYGALGLAYLGWTFL